MRYVILVIAAGMFLPACSTKKVVLREPGSFRPQRAPAAPKFLVLRAVDQRPQWEKLGDSPGVTLRIAGPGAAVFWWAGADVIKDADIVYGRNRYRGTMPSASTTVSSDLGRVLRRATGRPVQYWAANIRGQRQVARAVRRMRLPEGTVIVLPVIDHLTRVRAKTKQASSTQSKSYTATTVTTTTTTSRASQSVGPVWSVMLRLHVFEVRGGRVARHVVRYAAASSATQKAYGAAIVNAARQVVLTSAVVFAMANMATPQPTVRPPPTPTPNPTGTPQPRDPEQIDPEQIDPEQDPRNRPAVPTRPSPPGQL